MDEPLANLDAELRTHTRAEIRSLQRRLGTTTIYVTHDQTEAFTLGDRIAVLRAGRVVQVASPRDLYTAPSDTFVARFVGSPPMNIIPGRVLGRNEPSVGIRPDRAQIVTPNEGRFVGTVKAVEALGSHAIVHVDANGYDVLVVAPGWGGVGLGAQVGVTYAEKDLHSFDEDGRATR
jgi:ABC-type sugar transport system ATPase subunit